MDVPANLNHWARLMASSSGSSQVLQNLRDENCLDATDEGEFWARVRASSAATTANEAWNTAKNAVWQLPSLNRKRLEVPADRFANLVRFSLPEKLPGMFPTVDLASTGLSENDLEEATVDDLQDLLEEAEDAPEIQFHLLVWAAESSAEFDPATTPSVDLVNRLGLPTHHARLEAGYCCIELRYERFNLPASVTLHVPSSLDGIDNPQFRPNSDCGGGHGTTEPLDSGVGDGFPEAIHTGCNLSEFQITLVSA